MDRSHWLGPFRRAPALAALLLGFLHPVTAGAEPTLIICRFDDDAEYFVRFDEQKQTVELPNYACEVAFAKFTDLYIRIGCPGEVFNINRYSGTVERTSGVSPTPEYGECELAEREF